VELLDKSDDKASGYGRHCDLMWRIELAHAMIYARKWQLRKAIL